VAAKTVTGVTTIKTQRDHGLSTAVLKLYHVCQPGLAWLVLTILGLILRYGPVIDGWRWLSALLVLALGSGISAFDFHMRLHRATPVGRLIGPVTALVATLVTVLFILLGISAPLVLLYLLGGLATWAMWAVWLVSGDSRDLAKTFGDNAPAAGVPGASLRMLRERKPRRRREAKAPAAVTLLPGQAAPAPAAASAPGLPLAPRVVRAKMRLPADPAMTADEVGARLGHIENVTRSKPNSWSITSSTDDGGEAEVAITDPDVLTRAPIDWPGPSAPGADMSVPFRLGYWQDSTPFLVNMLPVHHRRYMGRTGTAKTMGAAWNQIGEGVTRESYAAFVMDAGKGSQFFGALRPALHRFETTEEGCLHLFGGLHRARLARCEYLAKDHFTEWVPECRLSYMDIWLEEAAVALRFLNPSRTKRDPGVMYVADWEEDVTNGRTAGESWNVVFQKAVKDQAASTVARSSMGAVCLGVDSKDDAKFGLTDEQLLRGAKPWVWKSKFPGMALWDADTIPEDRITIPMRFFNWPGKTGQIASYMSEWTADDRPLDDITAEALAWTPPVSPSSAYPLPAQGGQPGTDNVVRPVFGRFSARKRQEESYFAVVDALKDWAARGIKSFRASDLEEIARKVDRSRTWVYSLMPRLQLDGHVLPCQEKPHKRWALTIAPEAQSDPEETL